MFKIKFKVFENNDTDEIELNGADGYFQFQIENEAYGIYIAEDIEEFSVSIYWWFYYFLKSVLILKAESYVLISDIEKPAIWIELKKENRIVKVSKVTADKPEGTQAIETIKMPHLVYRYWKDKQVTYEELNKEIVTQTKLYIEELKSLNHETHKGILNLESLLLEVEK